LLSVNIFVALTGIYQLTRKYYLGPKAAEEAKAKAEAQK